MLFIDAANAEAGSRPRPCRRGGLADQRVARVGLGVFRRDARRRAESARPLLEQPELRVSGWTSSPDMRQRRSCWQRRCETESVPARMPRPGRGGEALKRVRGCARAAPSRRGSKGGGGGALADTRAARREVDGLSFGAVEVAAARRRAGRTRAAGSVCSSTASESVLPVTTRRRARMRLELGERAYTQLALNR